MIRTLSLALLLSLLTACGNDHWVDNSSTGLPGVQSWSDSDLGTNARDRRLPPVYVSRTEGPRGTYSYRIRGEEYLEREFLGLCRTLLRDDPTLTVRIVPEDRMTKDEIGLVSARIRDVGVHTVSILDTTGKER